MTESLHDPKPFDAGSSGSSALCTQRLTHTAKRHRICPCTGYIHTWHGWEELDALAQPRRAKQFRVAQTSIQPPLPSRTVDTPPARLASPQDRLGPRPATMAPAMCPACLDLDYDKFGTTRGPHGEDQSRELSPLPRYRMVPRHEVAAAADAGCNLCGVLREGMLRFWGDQAPQDFEPLSQGTDSDDGGVVDDDEIRRLHHNICIELRPERTLAVTWIGASWSLCYMLSGIQPQLEFYVDAGKLALGACSHHMWTPTVACSDRMLAHQQQENRDPLSVMLLVGLPEWLATPTSSLPPTC